MHALIHVAVLSLTIYALARLMPGIRVERTSTTVVVAVVFSLLNFLTGWLIKLLLVIPVILTLGLLSFFVPLIVNLVILWVTDKVLHAFEIRDGRTLVIASLAITIVSWLMHMGLGT